jgi:hypothetical protein
MVIPKNIERYSVAEGLRISSTSLTQNKVENLYKHPKVWIVRIQKMRWKQRIVCAFDERTNSAGMKTLQVIVSINDDIQDLKFVSAILSSRLLNFWCENYLTDDLNQSYLEKIPIPAIDIANSTHKIRYLKTIRLVDSMLILHKQLTSAKSETQKEIIGHQIESTDTEINDLVYELYGLTAKERKIVEESFEEKSGKGKTETKIHP